MLGATVKRLGKESLIYGLSFVIGRSMDVLAIPILTHALVPVDYGIVELVQTALFLMIVFMAAETSTAFYFFFEKEPYRNSAPDQARLFSSVLTWNMFSGCVIALITLGLYHSGYFQLFFKNLPGEVVACAMIYGICRGMDQRFQELFRILQRPWLYLITRASSSFLMLIAVCIFWFNDDHSLSVYYELIAISAVILLVVDAWFARGYLHLSLAQLRGYPAMWKTLLKFSWGLIPSAVAMYILNLSDRWVLQYHQMSDALGFYALAAKFTIIITTGVAVVMLSFQPLSMKILHDDDRASQGRVFDTIFRYYFLAFIAFALILSVLSPYIIDLVSPAVYVQAAPAIGWLQLTAVMFGTTYFTSLGTWKAEKVIHYSYAVIIACVLNVALNFYFVPKMGMEGSALASAIAMTALSLLSMAFSQRVHAFAFDHARQILQIAVAFAAVCSVTASLRGLTDHAYTPAYLNIVISIAALALVTIKPEEITLAKHHLSKFMESHKRA